MITGKRFSRLYLKATGAVFCKGGFGDGYHFVIRVSWEWAKTLVLQGFLHLRRLFPLIQSYFLIMPYISALLTLFFCCVPHIVPHFCGLFLFFKSYKFLVPLYLPTKRKGQLFFPIAGPDETLTQEQENIVQIFNLRFKASSRLYNRFCSIACGISLSSNKAY